MTRRVVMVLMLLSSACSTPAADTHRAGRVPAADLPAREREAWQAYRTGGAQWEIARESLSQNPDLARFVVDNLVIDMVRAYEQSRLAKPGEREGPFERAQSELVLLQRDSAPVLAELLAVGDGIVAYLAADTLHRIGAPAAAAVLTTLDRPKPEARRRAVELLARLDVPADQEDAVLQRLATIVRDDPAWIVRAEAARTLGTRGAKQASKTMACGTLSHALRDPDASVAEMAATGLECLGEPRAIPALIDGLQRFAHEGNVAGARAAQRALTKLAGDSKPESPEAWQSWWDTHQGTLLRNAPGSAR